MVDLDNRDRGSRESMVQGLVNGCQSDSDGFDGCQSDSDGFDGLSDYCRISLFCHLCESEDCFAYSRFHLSLHFELFANLNKSVCDFFLGREKNRVAFAIPHTQYVGARVAEDGECALSCRVSTAKRIFPNREELDAKTVDGFSHSSDETRGHFMQPLFGRKDGNRKPVPEPAIQRAKCKSV